MNSGREWDWMDERKLTVEHQIQSACNGGIAAMVHKGLRSFKVEVVDV